MSSILAMARTPNSMTALIAVGVLILLASCQQSPTPNAEFTALINADCHSNGSYCDPNSRLLSLGCHRIEQPLGSLSGLTPIYPIARCWFEPFRSYGQADALREAQQIRTEQTYLYETGCLMPAFARYIIWRNGQLEVLKTDDDFQRTFAPIETANEALSYAVAVTGLLDYHGLKRDEGHEYYVDSLEDTHATVTQDGYIINLYYVSLCVCYPRTTFVVNIHVTPQGAIREVNRTAVYRDLSTGEACVN